MKKRKELLFVVERWDPVRTRGAVCMVTATKAYAEETAAVYAQELIDRGFEGMEYRVYPVIYVDL